MHALAACVVLPERHVLAAEPKALEETRVVSGHVSGRRSIRHASGYAAVRSPLCTNAKPCDGQQSREWTTRHTHFGSGGRYKISNHVIAACRTKRRFPVMVREYNIGTLNSPRVFRHR